MSGKAGFRRAGGLEIPEVLEGEGIGRGYFPQQQFWEGFGRWVWSGPKTLQLGKLHTVALDEVTQMENFSLNFTGPTG